MTRSQCLLPILWLASVLSAFGSDLAREFQTPPRDARPWVFWMWLRTETTPEAITKDLEEMKAKGIVGFILFDSGAGSRLMHGEKKLELVGKEYRSVPTDDYKGAVLAPLPTKPLASWSPHWRELVRFASKEAHRLGLEFVLSVGLDGTAGPIGIEDGMQILICSKTPVAGGQAFDGIVPMGKAPSVKPPAAPITTHQDVALLAVPDKPDFAPGEVIDLSASMDAAGHLRWTAPAKSSWKLLRFSQVPTGARDGWGYHTDGMSAEAMDHTWAGTMAPLLQEMTPEERAGLRGVEDDSWEAGDCTWTKHFAEEFQRRRGYDLRPFLPLLAGERLADAVATAGVRRDYQLTISELIADYHYGRLHQLARENGLEYYAESTGPHPTQQDLLKNSREVDHVMGEFWVPSVHRPTPDRRFLARNAANASHLYGHVDTLSEAFTSVGPAWEDSPFGMKATGDQAFCDGVTRMCMHNYSQSPSLTAKPGYTYFAGTFYNRNITWWEQTPALNTYLGRCTSLLQRGKFVADALIYGGDNIGQLEPMKVIPHTLGEGYDHDNVNTEALLTRVNVKDGRLVLPDGMSYRVLILPENTPMPPKALEKIAALVEAGATVVGPRPSGFAGLPTNADDTAKFNALVTRLWGQADGGASAKHALETGRVVSGPTAREVLHDLKVRPDFEATGVSPAGTIDWIHRTTSDAEIYFVASRWEPVEKIACTFRVTGRQPELWDPVTGEIRDAKAFRQEKDGTTVPLEFGPCGSTFVVFRKPIAADAAGAATTNSPGILHRQTVAGSWDLQFDPKWGGPESIVFDQLVDWTKRPEEGIQHYSGTAIYRKTFDLTTVPQNGERLFLDLGEVHEVSTIRLNGVDLGVVWTKPARVDITRAAKAGSNRLEITVVNLWPNRLIGDVGLPPEKQFTETNMRKFNAATPLLPSGLLGPVEVLTETAP